jgi:hypothetical protein
MTSAKAVVAVCAIAIAQGVAVHFVDANAAVFIFGGDYGCDAFATLVLRAGQGMTATGAPSDCRFVFELVNRRTRRYCSHFSTLLSALASTHTVAGALFSQFQQSSDRARSAWCWIKVRHAYMRPERSGRTLYLATSISISSTPVRA